MALAPPVIVGPLTSCSRSIRLRGLVRHAAVSIDNGGQQFLVGTADWPDQRFDLPAQVSLSAGSAVRASQTLDAMPGPWSALVITVQDLASPPSTPVVRSPLVGCAQLVIVDEVSPDATVTVTDEHGTTLGGATAGGTTAVVRLNKVLLPGERVEVVATACAVVAHCRSLGAEPLVPPGSALETPRFEDHPLRACQRVVRVGGLRPGSIVTIVRGDGTEVTFTATSPTQSARIDPPLIAGEVIAIRASAADRCNALPSAAASTTVTNDALPPIRLVAQPCPSSTSLQLAGLIPSALVVLSRNGESVLSIEASDVTETLDLAELRLAVAGEYEIAQSLCGISSRPVPVWVRSAAVAASVSIREPLGACSRIIVVEGTVAGSIVEVASRYLGGQIALVPTSEGVTVVPVSPVLRLGDVITVSIGGCESWSGSAEVKPVDVTVPSISRAVAGESGVLVDQAIVGAIIEVRGGGQTLGTAVAVERVVPVATIRPLVANEKVEVISRWCGETLAGHSFAVAEHKALVFRRFSPYGIHNPRLKWHGGRVEGVIPLADGRAILATERAGIWVLQADGTMIPLSEHWSSTYMFCARADPSTAGRYFAGSEDGLHVSDPVAADPATSWSMLAGAPSTSVLDVLVLPGHRRIVIATGRGLWIAPTAGVRQFTFTVADPALANMRFDSLALGPDESVVAFTPGHVFVGRWSKNALIWTDRTFGGPTAKDQRLTTIAAQMVDGAVSSCRSNPSRVYLAVAQGGPDHHWWPVVRSDDGGWTWSVPAPDDLDVPPPDKPNPKNVIGPGELMGSTQGGRNLAIAAHPTDANTVIIAGRTSGAFGSTDGATSWDVFRWRPLDNDDFHADVLCLAFDDSSPPRLWAGSDGGVYSSDDLGVSWVDHNERFPTLMFDGYGQSAGVSLGVRSADPQVVLGGLQDNGLVWSLAEGERWSSAGDSDGRRVQFLDDDHALMLSNVSQGLWMMRWNGGGFDKVGHLNPPGVEVGVNDPILAMVTSPLMRVDNKRLIAVLADNEDSLGLWGLIDDQPGKGPLQRYRWVRIGGVPPSVIGLASYDGTCIIVTTNTRPSAPIRLFDTVGKLSLDCVVPDLTSGASVIRPAFIDASTAIAAGPAHVYITRDLVTWRRTAPLPSVSTSGGQALGAPWSLAVDRRTLPPTIFAGSYDGLWASNDLGTSWLKADGLPRNAMVNQTTVSSTPTNRIYAGTWNWSAWLADLQ